MKEAPLKLSYPEQKGKPGLCFSKLSFLGNGPYSMDIELGECVGITGKSGVGKTQLLRAVADVIAHDGDCFLEGISCLSWTPSDWRTSVAMVPAESFWWYDTVGSHFAQVDVQDETKHLMKQFGFAPDVMDWQISRLSTGERQRLSLIRTLVTKPAVLLLDEPTSALDKKMTAVVEELVTAICLLNKTVCLWVSHDLEQLFRVASRVYQLTSSGFLRERE